MSVLFSCRFQILMQDKEPKPITIKFLVMGDTSVGKSSLIRRVCDNTFTERYISTIGVDFMIKKFIIDSIPVRLMMWDTYGSYRYPAITPSYFRGCDAVLFVYSITDIKSLDNMTKRIEYKRKHNDCEQLLVGNKIDLNQSRELTEEIIDEFSLKLGVEWKEVSAKTAEGVDQLIQEIVRKVLKRKKTYLKYGEVMWESEMPRRPQTQRNCF